jgi:ABC-type transport system substrate-binding protein
MRKYILSVLIFFFLFFQSCFSEVLLKIGMQDEPKTLNPLKASDVWSWNVIGWFYETLYTREPITKKVIPWVADGYPEYGKKFAIVKMKKGITWEDGTPLTAEDVKFTADIFLEFKVPRYYSDWEFVEKVEVLDKYKLKFYIKYDCTPLLLENTLLSIILPKKVWEPIVKVARKKEEPLKYLLEYTFEKPLSCGPFLFSEWKKGSYIKIKARKNYFFKNTKVANKRVGPFYDGILFKIYGTTDAAIMALKKGEIDYFYWPVEPGFVSDLKKEKNITVVVSDDNGFFYVGFNLRKKPFSDINFRRAVCTLIDKDFITKRILQGYAKPAWTVVPPGNSFWYNSKTQKFGIGLKKEERIKQAKKILESAGYKWNKKSELLYPSGEKVPEFSILTPPADYDPIRAMCGTLIQEWLREAKIPATAQPTSFATLIQRVNTERKFDMYILGWFLQIDPDYLRSFFHSSQDIPEGYNVTGYKNKLFDKIIEKTMFECDREKRRELIFKAQKILSEELPYIPLYFRDKIEAYNNKRFSGWFSDFGGISGSILYLIPKSKK